MYPANGVRASRGFLLAERDANGTVSGVKRLTHPLSFFHVRRDHEVSIVVFPFRPLSRAAVENEGKHFLRVIR
jgi:hypothetical protein